MNNKDETLTPEEQAIWEDMERYVMDGDLEGLIADECANVAIDVRDYMAKLLLFVRKEGANAQLDKVDAELV